MADKISPTNGIKSLTILELEHLHSLDPSLEGKLTGSCSLLYWIWYARQLNAVSDGHDGFFLNEEQLAYWQRKGAFHE